MLMVCGASLVALGFGADHDAESEDHDVGEQASTATETEIETEIEAEAATEATAAVTTNAKRPGSATTRGGTLAVDRHGLLVLERSAGELVRADREGRRLSSLKLGTQLGELVHDGTGHAFVADRGGDRVVRIATDEPERLRELAAAGVPEPHGLALTPDGATLLITSVSDHALVAFDAETLTPRWELPLAPEPRAVAIAPDGRHAAVGFLSSGSLALVDIQADSPTIRWRSLEPRDHVETSREDDGCYEFTVAKLVEARSRFSVPVETGRRYVRNVYALQFLAAGELVAPHQLATPQLQRLVSRESSDIYGGEAAGIGPIAHRVATVHGVGELETTTDEVGVAVHQPRALAYDAARDRLYVGGYGDDRIAMLSAAGGDASAEWWTTEVRLGRDQACGIDGLAVDDPDHGGGLWVHCEFGRRVVRLDVEARTSQLDERWLTGEVLAESARAPELERGAELFRRSDPRISSGGELACSSCHPEGRSDGLTWRLGRSILQAPVLAGRVGGTGPYKWDGQDSTLHASLRHTMERLGGGGWAGSLSSAEVNAMVAYIESLPAPKPPSDGDTQAITRGREVFVEAGCDACHDGERLTDQAQHEFDTTLRRVDTPSLIGLAHSRPYFHDGSAHDLWTLLTDRGTVHDMADTSALSDAQLRDLVAYLESL